VDHVIAPLDRDHARVVTELAVDLAAALAIDREAAVPAHPHITLASYTDLTVDDATVALAPAVVATAPFVVRAHGYGIFTGGDDVDLSLHVMVVRTPALDRLHHAVCAALAGAGAEVCGTSDPAVWTPHVTLLDRGLTPHLLGRAVEVLAGRPHRTWSITVGSVAIGCRAHVTEAADRELPLGRTDPAAPSLGRACRGPTPEAPA
jgi:2'-5' RNA ligase